MPDKKYSLIPYEEWKDDPSLPDWVKENKKGLFRVRAEEMIEICNPYVYIAGTHLTVKRDDIPDLFEPSIVIAPGKLGGFVESEDNLSQEGLCFVHDYASVKGGARVLCDAQVMGSVEITEKSTITDSCFVGGKGMIKKSTILGCSEVSMTDSGSVIKNTTIRESSFVSGHANLDLCYLSKRSLVEDCSMFHCDISDSVVRNSGFYGVIAGSKVRNSRVENCAFEGVFSLDGCRVTDTHIYNDTEKVDPDYILPVQTKIGKGNDVRNCRITNTEISEFYGFEYWEDDEGRLIDNSSFMWTKVLPSCTKLNDVSARRSALGTNEKDDSHILVEHARISRSNVVSGVIVGDDKGKQVRIRNSKILGKSEIRNAAKISYSTIKDNALLLGAVKVEYGAEIGGRVVLRDNVSISGKVQLLSEEEFFGDEKLIGEDLSVDEMDEYYFSSPF